MSSKMRAEETARLNEGQRIAEQLGNGVVYVGPWLPYGRNGEFYGHFFVDRAVTGTSFVANTFDQAKAALIKSRREFGAECIR